ncbi:MAG TPA: hypothetical protein DCM87_10990 [Planctomycetes bacterium]|nr:hypothetical protein [Planctomycetota bacterium]
MNRALLFLAAPSLFFLAGGLAADEIAIQVSPSTIILDSDGVSLTIHTDIRRSTVDRDSLRLFSSLMPEEGLPVDGVYSDAHMNLVAEFDFDAVKAIVAPPSAILTLRGLRLAEFGGTEFSGTNEVLVRHTSEYVPIRGDANGDARLNIADAVAILSFLFSGGEIANPCGEDVVDTNDDDKLNIGDPIFLLAYLFAGGPAPDSSDLECAF